MRAVGASYNHGEGLWPGRGVTSLDRPLSPTRERHTSSSSRARARQAKPDQTSSSHDRRLSRDRSRHRPRRVPADVYWRDTEAEDFIPRYCNVKARHLPSGEPPRRRSRSRHGDLLGSFPSARRHRRPSHSPEQVHQKRSAKNHSPSRRHRGRSRDDADSRKRRRLSPHDRSDPAYRHRSHSYTSPPRSEDPLFRHPSRYVSRSPARHDLIARHPASRHLRASSTPRAPPLSRSPSPIRNRCHETAHRPLTPSTRPSRQAQPFSALAPDYPVPDPDRRPPHHQAPPPRSPPYQDQRRRDHSSDFHLSSRSDFDEDMAPRSSYRAAAHPLYSHRHYYANESRGSDGLGYSQSPPPRGGSYQNSPSMSPYRSSRPGRAGQYLSQQPTPTQYHQGGHGNYGATHGSPLEHNQSPSYPGPSGPLQSHLLGTYREGYRSGSFRGGPASSRGGYRGSASQISNRRAAKQAFSSRWSHEGAFEETASKCHDTADATSLEGDREAEARRSSNQAWTEVAKAPIKDASEPQKRQDSTAITPATTTAVPTTSRHCASTSGQMQPGTSGKFSFSFKPSSRPTPTTPRPEISQKFNALPPRKSPEPPKRNDRQAPRSAPTESASTRPQTDPSMAPQAPKAAPRLRRVKRTMRKLKARPRLSFELAASDSVFYRKPGNESVIGSGTYGKVFKGLNVYTKGLVALKRIRMEGERDGFPVTAVREIKLLQSLRHANVVNLQEVMVEKNDCFMVFEYLSHDLTGLLNHPSFKLDAGQKKHLAKQLFEGLDYLHTRGVLHRDIKAANILVSSEGVLKLADFGLARFYPKRHQLDYTNRVITIWYRSPELLLGETQYTAAVDIWSAACVLVEIFTKNAIFAGDGTELSQLEKIYNIMGTPNRQDWPGLVDMAWFELLRPTAKRKSVFANKYQDKVTPAAFDLLSSMFDYNPVRRPTAAEALQHAYFSEEDPPPRQAVELANIDGEWHEFESKTLRKENERRERETRKASKEGVRDKDKKRSTDGSGRERESKRAHVDGST